MGKFNDYALFTYGFGHSPGYTSKVSLRDTHLISASKTTLIEMNQTDMLIVDGGEADKVAHLRLTNREGRIFAVSVCRKVVVVKGQKIVMWITHQGLYLLWTSIDKNQIPQQRFGHFLHLSVYSLTSVVEGMKKVQSVSMNQLLGWSITSVRNAKYIPLLLNIRDIVYRHPISDCSRNGGRVGSNSDAIETRGFLLTDGCIRQCRKIITF